MSKMKKAITLRHIAEQLNLHVSTVSRVLNGSGDAAENAASDKTAQRIRALAEQLHYRPNLNAKSLRTQRSQTVGVLVPRLSDFVLATIYEGIDDAARRRQYFTFVANTHNDPLLQREHGEMAIARRAEGLIIADAHFGANDDFLHDLALRGVPFVLTNRRCGSFCAVTCHDYLGGVLAARHLLQQGHVQMAVVAGEDFASTGLDRSRGFLDECRSAGVTLGPDRLIHCRFDTAAGRSAGEYLLGLADRPTAIFAANDFNAIGVMGAARALGLIPGRDLAIVGFNDTPLASELPIPLSSVASPMHEMGFQAMELLVRRISGENPESRMLEPRLIVRESSLRPFPVLL